MNSYSYVKTREFWLFSVFTLWSVLALLVTALYLVAQKQFSRYLVPGLLVGIAVVVVWGMVRLTRWKNENPDDRSPSARLFLYGLVGLVSMQTVMAEVLHITVPQIFTSLGL